MLFLIQFAGLLHFVIAGTNFFAARLFRYRENMSKVSPFVREVFWVQNGFIVFTTVSLGALCLIFPQELAGASHLGRCLSGFLCLFWGARLAIQLGVYDAEAKRRFRAAHSGFTLVFLFLTLLFGAAAFSSVQLIWQGR
ncbi:hypothetical protein IAD21_00454 [Abditibacteriota bacterium]|nr:hypothetical protein IAD21_00454 [Abditibacteriota bacterium]